MYDPATGEGLVCVHGRCVSNKKKMQLTEEHELGFRGRGRNRNRGSVPDRM